jgi:SecD/SecF fusion protein
MFAMLIGIVMGTITSIFIASPVAYRIMSKQHQDTKEGSGKSKGK